MVVAEWQHVVYNEFLPNLLGTRVMETYGLTTKKEGKQLCLRSCTVLGTVHSKINPCSMVTRLL